MNPNFRKDQENKTLMDLKMRKRKREDSDVAGSPRTKIQGRSNFTHSTDPNVLEDVSVRKRRADNEGEVPQKKIRCSNLTDPTDHSEGPQEDESIQKGKRQACGDAGPLEEKTRCGITNTNGTDSGVVEDHLVGPLKRKASDEGEAPGKKRRRSDSSSSGSGGSSSNSSSSSSNSSNSSSGSSSSNGSGSSSSSSSNGSGSSGSSSSNGSGSSSNSSSSSSNSSNSSSSNGSGSSSNSSSSSSSSGSIEKREDLSSDDDESDVSQTSSSALTEEERIYQMSSVRKKRSQGGFKEKYSQLGHICSGGFGSVYAGVRKSDQLPVAIKYIPMEKVRCERVTCNGKECNIVTEVALMLKAAGLQGSVGQSAAVSLLDWYILNDKVILVMERPAQSMDLQKYLQMRGGSLDEREAKVILKQLVDAAVDMHSKGIFHRDIKLQNILIQTDSDVPRVRIIDFGCGTSSTDRSYSHLCGTPAFFPPEWLDHQSYWARPTTVWQLGAVFYLLLMGEPFSTKGFIQNRLQFSGTLSTAVKILLSMCLTRKPVFRITLEDLQRSPILR